MSQIESPKIREILESPITETHTEECTAQYIQSLFKGKVGVSVYFPKGDRTGEPVNIPPKSENCDSEIKITVNKQGSLFPPDLSFKYSEAIKEQPLNLARAYIEGAVDMRDKDLWTSLEHLAPLFLEEDDDSDIAIKYWTAKTLQYFEEGSPPSKYPRFALVEYYLKMISIFGDPAVRNIARRSFDSLKNLTITTLLAARHKKWENSGLRKIFEKINIESHYDLPEELYHLFLGDEESLGKETAYSCGFCEDLDETNLETPAYSSELEKEVGAMSLSHIQNNKFDLIARKLGLHRNSENGEKQKLDILDIGCGTGGLAIHLAKNYADRINKIVGITLSDRQEKVANKAIESAGLGHIIEIRNQNYQDLPKEESYDRIASVGMMEHVGRESWSGYMQKIDEVLDPAGKALIHAITTNKGKKGSPFEFVQRSDEIVQHFAFTGGELANDSEARESVDSTNMNIEHDHHFGIFYYFTLKKWYENFCAHEKEIREALSRAGYSEKRINFTIRKFKIYLASCAQTFKIQRCDLIQVVLNKTGETKSDEQMSQYIKEAA